MAKRSRDIELLFPTGGLVRRSGYQSQPPYTTPDCSNVRPFDPLEGRERGGSRPGLAKSFATQFGGGNPIQALASVSVADDDGSIRDVLLVISEGIIKYTNAAGSFVSPMVETVLIDEDTNNGYFETLGAGGTDVFGTWDETAGSGAIAYETDYRNTGAYSAKLTYATGEAYIDQSVTVTAGAECTIEFWTRGDGSVSLQYRLYDDSNTADIVAKTSAGVTGTTWTKKTVEFSIPVGCTSLGVYFYSPSSAGDAYVDDVKVTHRVSGDTAILSASKYTIPVVGMFQKFYIADAASSDISGTEGVVTSNVLTDYSVSDWSALGIDTDTDVIAITSTQLDELNTTRSIDFTTSGYLVLNGSDIDEGPVSYQLNRRTRSGENGYYNYDYRLSQGDTSFDWVAEKVAIGDSLWYCNSGESSFDHRSVVEFVEDDTLWLSSSMSYSDAEWFIVASLKNLLTNPGFETVGDGQAADSWEETLAGTATCTRIAGASTYSTGTKILKIANDASGNTGVAEQTVTVTPGREMLFDGWRQYYGGWEIYDVTNDAVIDTFTALASATSWTHTFSRFTVPAGCHSIKMTLHVDSSASHIGYFDDLSLSERVGGTGASAASAHLFTDASVGDDWTTLGIDEATDTLVYVEPDGTEHADHTIAAVYARGLALASSASTDTEPFSWTVSRRIYSGTDGVIGESNRLTSTSYPDWSAVTIADDDTVTLTRPQKTFTSGVYSIASVAAGGVTLDTDEVPDGSEYLYQIGRKIQVLDPDTGVLSVMDESEGVSPLNCSILSTFRGRLVGVFKNTWFMSRINVPTDWDYGADDQDTGRAVAGGVAEAADVPDPVTAAFAHTDDYFIFGCHGSLWLMRGDPGMGAEIDRVSAEVGIVGRDAWCHLDDGTLMFLSRAGVYLFPSGGVGSPVSFSEGIVPQELINVDGDGNVVTMCYDFVDRGIHLFSTPVGETAGDHWWIDWRNDEMKSLWPVSMPTTMQPFSAIAYAADPSDPKRVILGCCDGYLREFDDSAANDDGTDIVSYVKIGPFRMAPVGHVGIATGISAVIDADGASVSWELRVGQTGEVAVDSSAARASGTWSTAWNRPCGARVSGAVGVLYVAGPSTSAAWAVETINLTLLPGGRMR